MKYWLEELKKVDEKLDSHSLEIAVMMIEHMPFPCWYKNLDSEIIYINRAYTDAWHIERADIIHKKDNEVWGDDLAMKLVEQDQFVVRNHAFWEGNVLHPEQPVLYNDKVIVSHWWKVRKWPIFHLADRKDIIAIAGMATPLIDKGEMD